MASKLTWIRLELARTPEFPEGSAHHGYELTAPLDGSGHIDPEGWRAQRKLCTVRRFWAGEDDETGWLVHAHGRTWAFSYGKGEPGAAGGASGSEPIYHLEGHVFLPGSYVSVTEHDGKTRPFKVVQVA